MKIIIKKCLLFLILIQVFNNSFGQTGKLDSTFNNDGIFTCFPNGAAFSIAVQNDQKLIVGGISPSGAYAVIRLNTVGTLDSSFGINGKATTTINGLGGHGPAKVAIQNDGKIVLSGRSYDYDFAVIRWNSDGTLDNSFNSSGKLIVDLGGFYDLSMSIAIQNDNKIIIVGSSSANDWPNFAAIRVQSNGSLDHSFGTFGKVILPIGNLISDAYDVAIQTDGKILICGGSADTMNMVPSSFAILRLNANGTLDNSFSGDGKDTIYFNLGGATGNLWHRDIANAIVIQPDSKILLAGFSKTDPNIFSTIAMLRYNIDGTLDNGFGILGKIKFQVPDYDAIYTEDVFLQPDGKILVGGKCDSNWTQSKFLLARFYSNGSIDSSFGNNGIATTKIENDNIGGFSLIMQQDGKIVLTGAGDAGFIVARYLSGLDVGVLDLSVSENPLLIYPNPIQSQATLQYTLTQDEQITIELFDMRGKLVKQFIINETRIAGKHEEVLHMNELLSTGNYILSIGNGKNSQGIKVVKE